MKINHFFSMGTHVGDWLYAKCQQALIKKLVPGVEIHEFTLAANKPHENDVGLSASRLNNCDLNIIGGGPIYFFRHPDAWRTFIGDPEAVRNCKVPIIVWSTGLDVQVPSRVHVDGKRDLICAVHEKANAVAVRDQLTADFLLRLGFKSEVTGCAAHFVDLLGSFPGPADKLTFVYRKDMGEDKGEEIGAWCQHFLGKGYKIQFLCLSHADADEVVKAIPGIEILVPGIDVNSYLTQLGKSLVVVSFRVHASMPAAVSGIPSLLYWNGSRGLGWSQFAGLTDWNEAIEDFTTEKCIRKTELMLSGGVGLMSQEVVSKAYHSTINFLKEVLE